MDKNEIILLHGTEYQQMAVHLMRAADLQKDIGDRTQRIGIKPNLVVDAPAASGATTHPELVAGVIEYLQQEGFQNLVVLEGSWVCGQRPARRLRTVSCSLYRFAEGQLPQLPRL